MGFLNQANQSGVYHHVARSVVGITLQKAVISCSSTKMTLMQEFSFYTNLIIFPAMAGETTAFLLPSLNLPLMYKLLLSLLWRCPTQYA